MGAAARFLAQYPVGRGLFGNYDMAAAHYAKVFAETPEILVERLLDSLTNPFNGQYPPSAPQLAAWMRKEAEGHEASIRRAELQAAKPWLAFKLEGAALEIHLAARRALEAEAEQAGVSRFELERYLLWRWSDAEVRAAHPESAPEEAESRRSAVLARAEEIRRSLAMAAEGRRIEGEPGDGRPQFEIPGAAAIRAANRAVAAKGGW